MSDPKLVITKDTWDNLSHDQKLQITYDTTISTLENSIEVNKKLDHLINKKVPPCETMEKRVCKLEKWKVGKMAITVLSSFLGGIGGSHLPK